MTKSILLAVCIVLLASHLPMSASCVMTDPPSLSKLEKLAKDVKEKTSKKKTKTSDETTSEAVADSEVAETDTVAGGSSSKSVLSNILGGVASSATSTKTISNVVGDVIGLNKVTEKTLIGTWNYKEPGVGFTSESLLAEAGGEVAATACREKLAEAYERVGITPENTSFTFDDNGSFTAILAGHSVKGTYTFDEDNQTIVLKILILNLTGHTKRNFDGISIMFESQKILTLLETICKATGSKTLGAISDLSSNYDGVRVGFDLSK